MYLHSKQQHQQPQRQQQPRQQPQTPEKVAVPPSNAGCLPLTGPKTPCNTNTSAYYYLVCCARRPSRAYGAVRTDIFCVLDVCTRTPGDGQKHRRLCVKYTPACLPVCLPAPSFRRAIDIDIDIDIDIAIQRARVRPPLLRASHYHHK